MDETIRFSQLSLLRNTFPLIWIVAQYIFTISEIVNRMNQTDSFSTISPKYTSSSAMLKIRPSTYSGSVRIIRSFRFARIIFQRLDADLVCFNFITRSVFFSFFRPKEPATL